MNQISQSRTNQKITYIATKEGIERANNALKRDFGSKSSFAKFSCVSRSTITKFFSRKPIQFDSFQQICDELKLSDWQEIAGIRKREERKVVDKNYIVNNNPNSSREKIKITNKINKEDKLTENDYNSSSLIGTVKESISNNNDLTFALNGTVPKKKYKKISKYC